jgi:hypothetical protein
MTGISSFHQVRPVGGLWWNVNAILYGYPEEEVKMA